MAKAFLAEITATVLSAGTAGRSALADAGSVSTAADGEDGEEEGKEQEEEESEDNDGSLSTLDVVGEGVGLRSRLGLVGNAAEGPKP